MPTRDRNIIGLGEWSFIEGSSGHNCFNIGKSNESNERIQCEGLEGHNGCTHFMLEYISFQNKLIAWLAS